MTDTSIDLRTTGDAAKFLHAEMSDKGRPSYSGRDALAKALQASEQICVVFDLDSTGGNCVDLILFSDGTAFFASSEDEQYAPWPIMMAYGEQTLDEDEFLPPLDAQATDIDFKAQTGTTFNRGDLSDLPTVEAWVARLAAELADPPEALRDLIVSPEQDFYWEDRTGQARAQSLLAQFAIYYLRTGCTITIRANSDAGRTPTQRVSDARMREMMKQYAISSDHERDAMYAGLAYAEMDEADGFYYQALIPLNAAMAWFSARVLDKLGRPCGWNTDYNDGARDRMSGYSANAESILVDTAEVMSNHEAIRAGRDIAAFLDEIGERNAFDTVIADLGLTALPDLPPAGAAQ